MKQGGVVKIQTYCPEESANDVRMAIGKAGGGRIGNYSYCAFVSKGYGYFLPMDGAYPVVGEIGKIETVGEVKIEFVCATDMIQTVVEALKKAHPYEEVPIDVFQLMDY